MRLGTNKLNAIINPYNIHISDLALWLARLGSVPGEDVVRIMGETEEAKEPKYLLS